MSGTDGLGRVRRTRVVPAAGDQGYDTTGNADADRAARCQRCCLIHDRPQHLRRRWITPVRRRALGDRFGRPMRRQSEHQDCLPMYLLLLVAAFSP